MCLVVPQVESTGGTPLANVADVSVEIKAGSTSSAEVILGQISALLKDYTAMSVSPTGPLAADPEALRLTCCRAYVYSADSYL